MTDPTILIAAGSTGVVGLGIVSAAMLRGWNGWIELRRQQIVGGAASKPTAVDGADLARLRERVKRLESIASGVDF